jgi:hypothetical protein
LYPNRPHLPDFGKVCAGRIPGARGIRRSVWKLNVEMVSGWRLANQKNSGWCNITVVVWSNCAIIHRRLITMH